MAPNLVCVTYFLEDDPEEEDCVATAEADCGDEDVDDDDEAKDETVGVIDNGASR